MYPHEIDVTDNVTYTIPYTRSNSVYHADVANGLRPCTCLDLSLDCYKPSSKWTRYGHGVLHDMLRMQYAMMNMHVK